MSDLRHPSIRLSPRRHDVGAALMLQFRSKDSGTARNRRLRGTDVLRAFLLPMLCLTAAFAIKEWRGVSWMEPVNMLAERPAGVTTVPGPRLARRIAPDSPLESGPAHFGVRLTHIEDRLDDSPITIPVSLSREIRVAEEEAPAETRPRVEAKSSEPSLRAALHLGDQAARAIHR